MRKRSAASPGRYDVVTLGLALCAALAMSGTSGCGRSGDPPSPTVAVRTQLAANPGCSPDEGLMECDGRCVSMGSDPKNCGACGVACGPGTRCLLGRCTTAEESVAAFRDPQGWTPLGPAYGGRLTGLELMPSGWAYLPWIVSPGGGAWKEGASSWVEDNAWVGDLSGTHLEMDKHDTTRMYMSTYTDLYARHESDTHWTNLTERGGAPGGIRFAGMSDPEPFAQMLCGDGTTRVFHAWGCIGLTYSLSSGAAGSFQTVYTAPGDDTNPDNCIESIAADDSTGRVYISTESNLPDGLPAHIFASPVGCNWCTNSGGCPSGWVSVSTGLPSKAGFGNSAVPLAYTGTANAIATVVHNPNNGAMEAYLYNGSSWSYRGTIPATVGGQSVSGPDQRFLVWAGGQRLFWGSLENLTSGDLGQSWEYYDLYGQHLDVRSILPNETAGIVVSTTDGTGTDGSAFNIAVWNWTGPSAGPTCESGTLPMCDSAGGVDYSGQSTLQTYYVTRVGNTNRLFTGTQDNGGACSDDDGQSWSTWLGGFDDIATVVHPVNTNVGYAIQYNANFLKSNNVASAASCDATTWTSPNKDPYVTDQELASATPLHQDILAVDPRGSIAGFGGGENIVAVAGGGSGPVVSVNGGQNWQRDGFNVASVAFDDNGYLYAGLRAPPGSYGGIYRCTEVEPASSAYCPSFSDWEPFGLDNQTLRYVLSIRKAPTTPHPTYWAATSDGLYQYVEGVDGTTCGYHGNEPCWHRSTGGGGYVVDTVETIPGYPDCVYAGLGLIEGHIQHRGGVQFSSNNGGGWSSITLGTDVHQSPVADLDVDPDPHYLHVASFGRGVWKYDWGTSGALPTNCGGP